MKLKIGIGCGGGEAAYKKIRERGFDCVDFGLAHTENFWYTCTRSEFEKGLLQEKKWANESGIEIHQIHGPWDKKDSELSVDFTPVKLKPLLEDRKRAIEACTYLGCKNMVLHPIFPYTSDDTVKGMGGETYKINYDFHSELLETAKKYDVTICFENMPHARFSLNEVDKIKAFIDDINDEHFKACLDTGHVNCFETRSLGDAVRILGKDLRVLHVHDNRFGRDSHDLPFFGTADWDSFYEGLCDVGYNGVFNFETGAPWRLPDELYEEMTRLVIKMAKHIMRYDED